jgi:hypothetical protein
MFGRAMCGWESNEIREQKINAKSSRRQEAKNSEK